MEDKTMKAIKTTYHGPTNFRGSRIKATDEDGNSVYIPYPHELNSTEGHRKAAHALMEKMGWSGEVVTGSLKKCYVHVFK